MSCESKETCIACQAMPITTTMESSHCILVLLTLSVTNIPVLLPKPCHCPVHVGAPGTEPGGALRTLQDDLWNTCDHVSVTAVNLPVRLGFTVAWQNALSCRTVEAAEPLLTIPVKEFSPDCINILLRHASLELAYTGVFEGCKQYSNSHLRFC
jgi:hypothetical protein